MKPFVGDCSCQNLPGKPRSSMTEHLGHAGTGAEMRTGVNGHERGKAVCEERAVPSSGMFLWPLIFEVSRLQKYTLYTLFSLCILSTNLIISCSGPPILQCSHGRASFVKKLLACWEMSQVRPSAPVNTPFPSCLNPSVCSPGVAVSQAGGNCYQKA